MKKLLFVWLSVIIVPAYGDVWYVDDDAEAPFDGSEDHPYLTIQDALDNEGLEDGDVIIVKDGTYTGTGNRDMDFGGSEICLRSANGPENCTINCEGTDQDQHRAFQFHNSEGEDTIVFGFTITGGYKTYGAAVCCTGASPTIYGNIITVNTATQSGGAIYCTSSSSPAIKENTITLNTATYGGAIFCSGSSEPMVVGNLIQGNEAKNGGAIYCTGASPTIADNSLKENVTTEG